MFRTLKIVQGRSYIKEFELLFKIRRVVSFQLKLEVFVLVGQ